MPSNYGIVASSIFKTISTSIYFSALVETTVYSPQPGYTDTIFYDTNASPNFNLIIQDPPFDNPEIDQNITLEATLLDNLGNPVVGQNVYFYLDPVPGISNNPQTIGTPDPPWSNPNSDGTTMITDSNGKVSRLFSSWEWGYLSYSEYNIRAIFYNENQGFYQESQSPFGRVYFTYSGEA
jgi:hypothetical protein